MPRNTRAAARAQEAESDINIATDDTATEGSEPVVSTAKAEERPALAEMTSSAINEVEIAIEAVNEKGEDRAGKSTRRVGRGTKKGTSKGSKKTVAQKQDQRQTDNPTRASDIAEERPTTPSVTSSQDVSPEPSEGSADSTRQEDAALTPSQVDKLAVSAVAEELEINPDPQNNPAVSSEAAQQLQSLFEKPLEASTETMSPLVDAAGKSVLASPAIEDATVAAQETPARSLKRTASENLSQTGGSQKDIQKDTSLQTTQNKGERKDIGHTSARSGSVRASLATKKKTSTSQSSGTNGRVNTTADPSTDVSDGTQKPRSSIAALRTPPKPALSKKPPTKSTFQLPSEALRDKMKAQKEERQKRQDEMAAQKAQKKQVSGMTIKPVRKPDERRRSMVGSTVKDAAKTNEATKPASQPKPSPLNAQKRASTLVGRTRPAMADIAKPGANKTQERKSSGPIVRENKAAALRRNGSISRPSLTVPVLAEKKLNSKPEPKVESKKEEKPFDRGAAAKRARAEAAEKGRAASREWAEKKRREMEAKQAASKVQEQQNSAVESKENIPP
ncbi:MAG: hypothetical protein Q9162_001897 [Coniocarpon cinnabarinum]